MFDTDIYVSALLSPKSVPRVALDRAHREGNVLLSLEAITELREVLSRKRFRRFFDEEDAEAFVDTLIEVVFWIDVNVEISACRDPKDDKFLSLAVSGSATQIVTGDKDLLALDPFSGIRILTPQSFLQFP